ncbi:hypothetical protein H8959_006190 [Pygathrix nigripes]
MAASGESGTSGSGGSTEEAFMTFYSEVNTELAEDSGTANTQNYHLCVAEDYGNFIASWAFHIHEVGIGALHQAFLLVFPLLFWGGMKEILCERHVLVWVKQIEKRDSVLTSKNQIERLTRPGSSYFNLNPFEVLQIDPEVTDEEIKKRFRQLSILVHPDKNQDDADRAQKAFEGERAKKTIKEGRKTYNCRGGRS